MNYFEGLSFYLLLLLLLVPAVLLGALEKPLRWYGLGASLLVAAFVFAPDPGQGLWVVLYLVWSLLLLYGYLAVRKRRGREAGSFHGAVVAALLPLVLCKVTPWFSLNLFGFTGISYLTFRVLQILIETYDGVISELKPAETLAFLIFFPSFSAGPIDRSRRFSQDWQRVLSRQEYLELCADGAFYLLLGAVEKFVLAAWAFKTMGYLDTPEALWYHHIGYAYAYSLYLYFDFAGYSSMALGTARILGVQLPPNFRLPFVSVDIREFWDRWHISLSHWFRDFVFTRFIMFSTKKKWFGNRTNRACVGFLVNMGIMGIWHGLNLHYILYGLYHGLLLAGTEIYQKKSGFYKKNRGKTWYRTLSWFVTLQLVVFGFYLFSGKPLQG